MLKRKRRLNEAEVAELLSIMENASQDHKPSVRQLARYFHCNQPSILKSLGGWKGIQRGKPSLESTKRSQIDENVSSPATIEEFTTKVPEL